MDPSLRKQLEAWDRQHVWHPFTQMAEFEPLIIERGAGCTLIDVDGRQYLDGVSSLWCNLHGHRHKLLDQALRDQLEQIAHTTALGTSHPTTIRLAKELVDISPEGLEHVFFSDNGATAVEVALKMAFQYFRQRTTPSAEKTIYVAYDDAYHGDTLGGVSVGGVARFHQMFSPLLFEVIRLPAPCTPSRLDVRQPIGSSGETNSSPGDGRAAHLEKLRAVLESHHGRIAAVVIEPLIQCAAGMRTHPPGYLRGVRELTKQHDVLLIADEVAVGFGRTGKMFACEHEEVVPDLLCLAKGLTAGYLPMGATLATEDIFSAFLGTQAQSRQFFHGHTYGGNPLAASVALASLRIFREEQVLEQVQEKIHRLTTLLTGLEGHPRVGEIRQRGLIAGIEIVSQQDPLVTYRWEDAKGRQVCRAALQHGVLLRPLGNVIVVMPPLAISFAQLEQIMHAIRRALDELDP